MTDGPAIHATALVLGERGILIRGEAGAGKSSLADELIAGAAAMGRYAALVADDRVILEVAAGRLVARPHPALAGLVELRGLGLMRRPFMEAAILHLCVDLDPAAPRLPDGSPPPFVFGGVALPRIVVNRALAPHATRWRLRSFDDIRMIAE